MSAQTQGPAVVRDGSRRKQAPFRRSRSGCATCKTRGKKCDEQWNSSGSCDRCSVGGWRCEGPSPVPPVRPAQKRKSAATEQERPLTPRSSRTASIPEPTVDIASTSNSTRTSLPAISNSRQPDEAHVSLDHSSQAISTGISDDTNIFNTINEFPWDNINFDWNQWNAFPVDFLGSAGQESGNSTTQMAEQLLQLPRTKPVRQGVSLAEIYARVVESWLVGLPSAQRDYARTRIMSLNDSNSVMRNVRFAVSVAYIILFSAGPQGAQDPQVKLVELAYKGAGKTQPSPITDGIDEIDGAASTSGRDTRHKLRLYADNVSRAFAADEESKKWTDEATWEIRGAMVHDKAQLSDMLWGVIDLQLVEFIRGGAAPSYNMLTLGDRLVRSIWQESHPSLCLDDLRSSETFSLRLYTLSDISRCIVHRGRRTIFNFSTSTTAASADEEPWSAYLGLPDAIVMLLVDIVNLCADSAIEDPASVRGRAQAIETALRGWQQPLHLVPGLDPTAIVSRTIAGQLWRLSGLVLLYQSVHKVGGLHPVLRQSRDEILALLDSLVQLPNGDLWGFIALPSFLASVLSVDQPLREKGLQHMKRAGPERVWLDNIALVEAVWEEVDRTGRLPDWHDKMTREGLSVAFF